MNRMIALWAHPRSRSTVLERVFIERGDFEVFHEPLAHMAFDKHSAIPSDNLECGLPTTYEGIKAMLRLTRQRRHVFHKDMAYHCLNELKRDPTFLLEQEHIFIIREPRRSILSHFAVFPDMPLHAIGHEALFEVFCRVAVLTGKIPYVINADALALDPEASVRDLCEHLGLDFLPDALHWNKACPPQWMPWRSWHKAAEDSTHIMAPEAEDMDDQLFEQYPRMKAYYDHHRPFYERMNRYTHGGIFR